MGRRLEGGERRTASPHAVPALVGTGTNDARLHRARVSPDRLSPEAVAALQRRAGNAAVSELLAERQEVARLQADVDPASVHGRLPSPDHVERGAAALGQRLTRSPGRRLHRCCFGGERTPPAAPLRSKAPAGKLAKQLIETSPEFRDLKERADDEVTKTFGRPLEYRAGKAGQMDYHEGVVRIAKHGSSEGIDSEVDAMNRTITLVYETAHAVQAGKYKTVREAALDGTLRNLDYGTWVSNVKDLGSRADEVGDDISKKYALIAEYLEWEDARIAEATMREIWGQRSDQLKHADEKRIWGSWAAKFDMSFEDHLNENPQHMRNVETMMRFELERRAGRGGELGPSKTKMAALGSDQNA